MDVREKLVELLTNSPQLDVLDWSTGWEEAASYLITHGVTVQEWFSVKDPPKENGYYMCWLVACSVGEKKKCEHRKLYWEDNLWLSCAKSFRIEHPLYWMPLPQPPKGE